MRIIEIQSINVDDVKLPLRIFTEAELKADDFPISAVHATAAMNSWMDCFVLVEPKDIQQTARAVRKAYDEFWNDADGRFCYGDAIKEAMDKLGCRYRLLLCDYDEDTDEPTDFWEKLSDWIRWSLPTYEVQV